MNTKHTPAIGNVTVSAAWVERLQDSNAELLEALKVAMKSLRTYGSHPLIEKQVRAAIAKATGL